MQNKNLEKIFFDKFGQYGYEVFHGKVYKKFLNFFVKLVNPIKGSKCLEIGCGSGAFTKYIATLPINITAVDISEGCINYAKQYINKNNVKFIVGDIESLPFPKNTFDIVISSGVIHHFANDLSKVAKEIYKVLKPKGRFFAYEPNMRNPFMYLYRSPKSPFYSPLGVTKNERPLKKLEIMKAFYQAGFSKIKIFATSGVTYKYLESKIALKFCPIYNLWEKFFNLTPLSKIYGSFLIIVANK